MVQAIRSKKTCQLFKRFELSVPKNYHPFEQFKLSIPNDSSAVWMVWAIRSKKKLLFVNRSNGSSYLFKRKQNNYYTIVDGSNGSSYPVLIKLLLSVIRALWFAVPKQFASCQENRQLFELASAICCNNYDKLFPHLFEVRG